MWARVPLAKKRRVTLLAVGLAFLLLATAAGLMAALALPAKAQTSPPWSAPKNVSNSATESFTPRIKVDSGGTKHAVWYEPDAAGNPKIAYATKPSGGSWSPMTTIADGKAPDLAIDSNDIVHVVYRQLFPDTDIFYISKPASSGAWSAPLDISNTPVSEDLPVIGVDSSGMLQVLWMANDGINPLEVYWVKRSGGVWSTASNISNTSQSSSGRPRIAVEPGGKVHALWPEAGGGGVLAGVYYSSYGPWPWTAPVDVANVPAAVSYGNADVAVDGNGVAHAVMSVKGSDGISQLYYRQVSPLGPASVNITNTAFAEFNPVLEADASGNLYLVWIQTQVANWLRYMTRSVAGAWNSPETIAAGGEQLGGQDLALDGCLLPHVVWHWKTQTAEPTDIWYSTKATDGPCPGVTPTPTPTLTPTPTPTVTPVPKVTPEPPKRKLWVYSAKYVCGGERVLEDMTTPNFGTVPFLLETQVFRTEVNIHNYSYDKVIFQKKAVVANPQGVPRGKVSPLVTETLYSNEALEVNCDNVWALLGVAPPPDTAIHEGFVVVESPVELEVTAVYRATINKKTTGGDVGAGISVDVVQIQPHPLELAAQPPTPTPTPPTKLTPAATPKPAPGAG
ncbi:MAG: hypothetical protein HY680_04065 [Chloroflexi bacterium]|nr:hypothetical protein [Chloroflexota bacterium]